jgi:hypothetical protein
MAVRAEKAQILGPVVVVAAVDVIDLERDGRSQPAIEPTQFTLSFSTDRNERPTQVSGTGSWSKI